MREYSEWWCRWFIWAEKNTDFEKNPDGCFCLTLIHIVLNIVWYHRLLFWYHLGLGYFFFFFFAGAFRCCFVNFSKEQFIRKAIRLMNINFLQWCEQIETVGNRPIKNAVLVKLSPDSPPPPMLRAKEFKGHINVLKQFGLEFYNMLNN